MNIQPGLPETPETLPGPVPMIYVHTRPVWVYKQLTRDLSLETLPDDDELNTLGAEGWELVSIVQHAQKIYFYFKRLVD